MNLNDLDRQKSSFLDMLRGVASFFVMIHHVKNAFFTSYASLDPSYSSNLLVSIFYFFTGFGRLPVLLFFVLSGFFISRSILKMFRDHKWSWEKYLIDRVTRLELVLIPALLLTCIWDNLSRIIANNFNPVMMNGGDTGIQTFIGNILFLQTVFFSNFGSNYPLWSLSNEFWYYIIFPLIVLLIHTNKKTKKIIILSIILSISTIILIKNPSILQYFSIWLLGVIPIFIPTPKKSKYLLFVNKNYQLISLILVAIILILFRKNLLDTFWGELFTSSIFSLIIYLTISCSQDSDSKINKPSFFEIFSQKIASFSYTLYLVHAPIINFFINVSVVLGFGLKWKPSSDHILYHFLISTIIILYAMIIAKFTEANTNKVRTFVSSIIHKFY